MNDDALDEILAGATDAVDDPAETSEEEALERARQLLGTSVATEERPDVPEAGEAQPEAPDTDAAPEAAEQTGEGDAVAEPARPPSSPFDLPGAWYVIHSYSGYENKVKANLTTRITSMHMEDSIFDVVIPMEDVVEIKGGRKVTVPRKQFPGYLLVRMYLDDDSWGVVRNTPGVTGFVGSGTKPTPLSRREVERILGVRKDEEKKAPRFKPDWEVGETVRVTEGPFADFNGVIEDINLDQSKVRVLVDIFGRETPVELNFEQIQKF
jgi:transcriptional antiterminator NusG